jgi:hypothetical protein
LIRRCRLKSIPAQALPFRGELDIRSAAAVAACVKRGKFRILHAHTAHSLGVCLLAKMALPSTVLVATRHVAFHVRKRIVGSVKYDNRSWTALYAFRRGPPDSDGGRRG